MKVKGAKIYLTIIIIIIIIITKIKTTYIINVINDVITKKWEYLIW